MQDRKDRLLYIMVAVFMAVLALAMVGIPGGTGFSAVSPAMAASSLPAISNGAGGTGDSQTMAASYKELQANPANFGGPTENGTARYMGVGAVSGPHYKRPLWVFGNIALFERASDSAGFIIQRTETNRWVFGVNNADIPANGLGFVISTYPLADEQGGIASKARLLVTQDGRVGINTITPHAGAKLTVVNDNATNGARAIYGETAGGTTQAVYGKYGTSGPNGYLGGSNYGAYGENTGGGTFGVLGES